jgi:ubiquinone/menaquinone biosynthesis C-methylase UbiE
MQLLMSSHIGCANGWFSERLMEFGSVTAVDLADEVIARARARLPEVNFLAGDFLQLDLPSCNFDLIVSLETLAYV